MNAVERIEQVFISFWDNPQLAARVERIEAALSAAGQEGLALAGRVATADYTWRYVVTRLRSSVMIYR